MKRPESRTEYAAEEVFDRRRGERPIEARDEATFILSCTADNFLRISSIPIPV